MTVKTRAAVAIWRLNVVGEFMAVDRRAATLASWMGVSDTNLALVAPSICNYTQRNLEFLG